MRKADLEKMAACLDEVRKLHATVVEGVKITNRALVLINKQMELMEDEFHAASGLAEPEN